MADLQEPAVQALHNKYSGRVFIFGNGPSLLSQDLSGMEDENAFVCNSWFRWQDAPFTPTFFAMNTVEWKKKRVDPVPDTTWVKSNLCFLLDSGYSMRRPSKEWLQVYKENYQVGMVPEYAGIKAPLRRIPSSATSPFVMACLAIWMGFREIYFLGVDTTTGYMYDEKAYRVPFVDKQNGKRWQGMKPYFRRYGVHITDCTPKGNLNRFLGYTPLEKVLSVRATA